MLAVSVMAALVLMRFIVIFGSNLYSGYVSTFLGEKLLIGIMSTSYEWIISKNTADIIQCINWRVHLGNFLRSTLKAINDILIVTIMLISVFIVEPVISLPCILIIGILSYFLFTRIRSYLDRVSIKIKNYKVLINRNIHKSLHGIKDIKIYNRENLFVRHYHNNAYIEAKASAFQQTISQCPNWIMEFIGLTLIATSVIVMFLVMNASSIKTTGTIALLAATAWRILPAVSRIIQYLSDIRKNLPFIHTVIEYLQEIDSLDVDYSLINKRRDYDTIFKNEIAFNNVAFFYQGYQNNVLIDVNFKIIKGESFGIIGVSGAGKSTLVDLLIGLLNPTSGEIKIDGKKIEGAHAVFWAAKIGYVPQSPYICVGSLAENVAFGFVSEEIDRDRVIECCQMAAMDDFLWDLASGIDTQIGERGVKLSGGQKQRVAIARALYHSPEILIFDEATSSLDTKSEKAIQQTIYSFKGKQTLVIIAHRLSTVENCDNVIWLQQGRIKKIGSPNLILPEYRSFMKQGKIAAV
jgi:ABC-type multidrug transport system fused ATPase/permease subunit